MKENLNMEPVTAEGFEAFLDGALEPVNYPGDAEAVPATEGEDSRAPWSIPDESGAAWALRRVERARQEIEKAERLAAEQKSQIERYVAAVKREHERTASFFEAKVVAWYLDSWLPERGPKESKTCKLPGGAISSTKGRVSTVVSDPERLVEWLTEHKLDAFLRPRDPEPALDALKAATLPAKLDEPGEYDVKVDVVDEETGEVETAVVPGVKFVLGATSYKVKPEGSK